MYTRIFSRFLTAALLIFVSLSIVACGNNSSAQNSATPTSSSVAQNSATPTPDPASSNTQTPQSQIMLSLDKARYTTHDRIQVTITNHLSAPIYISAYYTNCTAVSLELNVQNGWIAQGRCPSAAPHSVALQPGASLLQQLTPSAATPQMAAHAAWQAGTYRIALFYTLSPDGDTTQGETVLSHTFSIG